VVLLLLEGAQGGSTSCYYYCYGRELACYIHAKLRSLNRFQSSPSLFLSFSLLWRLRSKKKKKKKTKIQVAAAAAIATAFS
jgi:hypothetical protein